MGRVEFRKTASNYRWEVLKLPLRGVEYLQIQCLRRQTKSLIFLTLASSQIYAFAWQGKHNH